MSSAVRVMAVGARRSMYVLGVGVWVGEGERERCSGR